MKIDFDLSLQGHTNIKLLTDSILNNEPISLKLSDKESMLDKIIFVLLFPLIAILWICMNWFDVRKPSKKNLFIINYILSIIFMGALAYLAVWWGTITGSTLALSPEIMGLTFFAIGFSLPIFYLIIKASKYGCGTMIFSMTSGINIFNMTIGYLKNIHLYSNYHVITILYFFSALEPLS